MAPGWGLAAQRALAGDLVKPAILFHFVTDPVIRLWAGVGDLAIAADLVEDEDGAIYTGMGELLSPPEVNALVNGLAERVEFGLSGVAISGAVAALASQEAASIRGAAVNLGFFVFGPDHQQLSPTLWLWDGVADNLKVNLTSTEDGGELRTVSVSVGSIMTGRQRPALSYLSPRDQRRRSANDAFCDHVPGYDAGVTKVWPS